MLEVRDIHTYYGDSYILQGVSLRVTAGQVVALLGRNGAGKTTTIHSIVGFVPPRRGQIVFKGEEITQAPPHRIARQGVGLVPQGRRLFPNLTVEENITLAARTRNGSAQWTLEAVYALFPRLKERARNRASQLSGGEQQMVAIARALMTNPDLLLLDEPSEGLAPLLVREISRVLADLKARGLSFLLVEQNLHMATSVADWVYVMNKGQIVFEGSPQTLLENEEVKHRYLGV
ncbi:MAG: ABC transporter ATP-binding protein [Ardenticatenia bacterium]|nr:ABC transporter ATP-binding protein [Ardenticatenia bacterium]